LRKIRLRLKASYVLIPKLLTPVIDARKQIEVEIYLTGSGPVSANKLSIILSSKYLVNPGQPGTIESCIATERNNETGESRVVTGKSVVETLGSHALNETGTVTTVVESFFQEITTERGQGTLNTIYGEGNYDGLAPFVLRINTRKKIPKGDYTIDITFTYSDGQEMATDFEAVKVHVTDFAEKHSFVIFLMTLAGTIIGAAGLIASQLGQ
jgi:hypothetical protein